MKSFVSSLARALAVAALVACSNGGNDAGSAPPPIGACPSAVPVTDTACAGPNVCTYDSSGALIGTGTLSGGSQVAICPDVDETGAARWKIEQVADAAIDPAHPIDGGASDAGDATLGDGDAGVDASEVGPDATDAESDAGESGPDAAEIGPDASEVGADATEVGPDSSEVGADASDAASDSSEVGADASEAGSDAGDASD